MSLVHRLIHRSQPLVGPEPIRYAFPAQTGISPYWLFVPAAYLVVLARNRFRIVAVTDSSIVLLRTGMFVATSPKEVTARFPRAPFDVRGGLFKRTMVTGKPMWVHARFAGQARDADAELEWRRAHGYPPTGYPPGPPTPSGPGYPPPASGYPVPPAPGFPPTVPPGPPVPPGPEYPGRPA